MRLSLHIQRRTCPLAQSATEGRRDRQLRLCLPWYLAGQLGTLGFDYQGRVTEVSGKQ